MSTSYLPNSRTIYCSVCEQTTDHIVQERHAFNENHERELLTCPSCYSPSLRWANRECQPPFERIYPSPDVRKRPPWIDSLPPPIAELFGETLRAFAEDHLWLVAMGSRTLIDMFALDRVGDVGGFAAKLEHLEAKGYLSRRDVVLIRAAIQVGHEATHRALRPSAQDCHAVLDIVEHLLQRIALDSTALDHLSNRSKPPARA